VFADLGTTPLANSYVSPERAAETEPVYPLRALVCSRCFLVQLESAPEPEELFTDYTYFSSYSTTWLEHARSFAEEMVERLDLGPGSTVVEVGSNDGYLLQYFLAAGVRVLGVEPAANVASVAQERGIPTAVRFFGREAALELREEHAADLLVANNVLAHVPDINGFVAGIELLLGPGGVATLEFPHLVRLVEDVQFDTIYHEHVSYLSVSTATRIFEQNGLRVFAVDELRTHGGSVRIYACRTDDPRPDEETVTALLAREREAGYDRVETYLAFADRVQAERRAIRSFFVDLKAQGASIAGYGAPAKANTLLNCCGLGTDFIDYTVDRSPHKQGCLLPGTRIPILDPGAVERTRPDFLFILPWNLNDEVMEQMRVIREWGGRFVVRSPELAIHP
jgi:SAM-dependent methyltransferase